MTLAEGRSWVNHRRKEVMALHPEETQEVTQTRAPTTQPSSVGVTAGSSAIRVFEPSTGDTLGPFQLEQHLGSGGMGEVFVARPPDSEQRVAIKILSKASADALYRFKREFRAIADLRHDNLISLGELTVLPGGRAFFTMELVEDGRPFTAYVRGQTPPGTLPNLYRLYRALRQLSEGLVRLHDSGCIHRDLKPSNVLVTPEGRVVILDFGLIAELDAPDKRVTNKRELLGTPAYMAPEQSEHSPHVGLAADYYGLGIMLYECLTGEAAFAGSGLRIMVDKCERSPDPSARVAGIPEPLADLCRGLLRIDPDQRFGATEITAALDELTRPQATVLARTGAPRSGALPRAAGDEAGDSYARGRLNPSAAVGPLPHPPAPIIPTRRAPFVGRATHLNTLTRAYTATPDDAVTVHIRGPSGHGKSALVSHFLETLNRTNSRDGREPVVLRGRCYERESVPYKGIDAVVDALSVYLRRLTPVEAASVQPRHLAPLVQMFPVLETLWKTTSTRLQRYDPSELRELGLASLREVFIRVGDRRPLVVFIDDFQWADVDSARVLSQLIRPPEPPAMLLLVAFRDDAEPGSEPESLRILTAPENLHGRDVRELAVGPLLEDETRALALALLRDDQLPNEDPADARIEQWIQRSRGNPFFLGQLALDTGQGPNPSSAETAPEHLVARRVLTLAPDERHILGILAVAGRPLAAQVVLAASEYPGGQALLLALTETGLVQFLSDGSLEISHDRIREVMVGELEIDELETIHRHLAETLERDADHTEHSEALAIHWEGAGELSQAADYAERAAKQAAETVAFEHAVELYRWTLELLPIDAEPSRRARVRGALAEQLANLGQALAACELFVELAAESPASEARIYSRRAGGLLLSRGRIDEGLNLFAPLFAELGERLPRTRTAQLIQIAWERLRLRMRGPASTPRSASELPPILLERIDTLYAVIHAVSGQEQLLSYAIHSRGLRLALDAGEPRRLTELLIYEAVFAAFAGDTARSEELLERCSAAVSESDSPHFEALIVYLEIVCDYAARGDCTGVDEMMVLRHASEGIAGVQWMQPTLSSWIAASWYLRGDWASLRRECPRWIALARERGNDQEIADLAALQAIAATACGAREDAEQLLGQARRAWTAPRFAAPDNQIALAELTTLIYAGGLERAATEGDRYLAQLRRWRIWKVLFLRYDLLDLCARIYAALALRNREDRRLRRRAHNLAKILRRADLPQCQARAAVIEAALSQAEGRQDAAPKLWRSAIEGFESAELDGHLAAVQVRLGRVIGGEEGAGLLASAETYFEEQGVVDSERIVDLLAPAITVNRAALMRSSITQGSA